MLLSGIVAAQGLTGALIGTVKDAQGGVLPGAVVRISSPALIGGPATLTTNDKGQLRFPTLPPGPYALDIELPGFATYHEEDIRIGAGATIERTAVLELGGVAESIVVEGPGSRIEARNPGFGTRLGPEDIKAIPTRRSSMFDLIRAAPGISPTSQASRYDSSFLAPANGKAATSAPDFVASPRTSAGLSFAIGCGSSRDTSICATTTVNQAPTRISRGPTSRTRSSRSSRGDWLRRGSWCKACTTSTGSTPSSRRP